MGSKLSFKRCPSCGSTSIVFWLGAIAGAIYKCKKCGYRGPVIIEEDLENFGHKSTKV